jgi:hypothetical protein
MKTIKVIFKDNSLNYVTSINEKVTEDEVKRYFVDNYFNLGNYQEDNLQKCIDIEFINN